MFLKLDMQMQVARSFLLKSKVLRGATVYTGTNILNAAIPFLLLPVFTRYLTPSDYGTVTLFSLWIGFLTPLLGLSSHGAMAKEFFKRTEDARRSYATACLVVAILGSVFGFVALLFVYPVLPAEIMELPRTCLFAAIVVVAGQNIIRVVLTILQSSRMVWGYGLVQISQTLCGAALSLVFVVVFLAGWQGRIYAQLLASVSVALGVMVWFVRSGWVSPLKRADIYGVVSFGWPLLPHSLSGYVSSAIDRLVVANILGLTATGVYSVGLQFGAVIAIIETSFNQAWTPWFFEQLTQKNPDRLRLVVRLSYIYFVAILLAALALGVLAPFLMNYMVGKSFAGSSKVVTWVAISCALNGMYKIVVNYLFFTGNTGTVSVVTVSSLVLNGVLTWILVKNNGAVGAAQAATVTASCVFIAVWIAAQRRYPMPWASALLGTRRFESTK